MADALSGGAQDGSQVSRLQQAYQRRFQQPMAFEADELLPIKVDIGAAYTLAAGVLVKIRPDRAQLLSPPLLKRELECRDKEPFLG